LHQDSYATTFTSESLSLFDEVLARKDSWIGIPPKQKRSEVTKIQQIVELATENLLMYSTSNQMIYNEFDNIGEKLSLL